ncbi:ABC transporter ATP-binding protein [Staphylococcus delphini]|uniref:Teichoic acid ABC transporter ATP-binding protein n=1 Tax=Staphylococcus delphini TaxID=53344 RepID=A0AAX0QWI7_9STAP|nr:ABC transporter ATP-binding protein [Staphylococcus delphini]NBK48127.1 ABC transporter ATP-binding protein [Staphylococcus delphini]PCF34256.1 teichoic acid ABC transporter ATP-binding protein [Staphylococcus delphini]PCF52121.1 teichoic acid ABC transporter ATP-binding protein [Staphylococcus delphini]PNZ96387.1 teichoic acid ABC transporter ATP-binding protein [Staphylococcus delphini]RIZ54855.1 teichoic acid ABC transporter ATP-binding protein [Staphylococcus delphini]
MPAPQYNVICENVTKIYDLNRSRADKLLSLFTFGKTYSFKPYYALKDVSFKVERGTSVGIIGLNGSGKSTLSNILGEVVMPTYGEVHTEGKPSLIAIGAGLNPSFTGEENIRYKCLMHGMSTQEINEKFDEIVKFSELDEFIYQPLKSYSSGMKSRLGFSIAIHTDPDILIVDEALSVGDETFSNKCIERMKAFQEQGKTIFFVSHSASQIRKMCDKALWIHYGQMVAYDDVHSVIKRYNALVQKIKHMPKSEQVAYKKKKLKQQQVSDCDVSTISQQQDISLMTQGLIGVTFIGWIAAIYFQLIG